MSSRRGSGQQSSVLLDAVFDRLEGAGASEAPDSVFRAEALARLNVPEEIDNRLTLVGRRTWLVLTGIAVLVVAAAIAAVFVPIQRTVTGSGRVLVAPGVLRVVAVESGRLDLVRSSDDTVQRGDEVARLVLSTGEVVPVSAAGGGRVWQQFATVGEYVQAGDVIATLLPEGDGTTVLVAVTEAEAARVRAGMDATVVSGSTTVGGVVLSVGPPSPATAVAARLGLALETTSLMVVVALRVDAPLAAGDRVGVVVTISSSTMVRSILRAEN